MLLLALKLTLAPGLVAATTLAGRRWGPRVAGWLGGLPVVVGPILLALALERGEAFAARAAAGALFGLVALNAFALAYAWAARVVRWAPALLAGWAAAALAAVALDPVTLPAGVALLAACVAAALTEAALPRGAAGPSTTPPPWDLALRTAATAGLVLLLTGMAGVLGARLSGVLAAFPVLASVLAAFTHAQDGARATAGLLRGLVRGLFSFAIFCFVIAAWIESLGLPAAFAAATLAALAAHAATHFAGLGPGRRGKAALQLQPPRENSALPR